MKKLRVEFQSNADGCGLETFKQIKRTDKVAMYERIRKDGTLHCVEVFLIKTIKAGTVFAKGSAPTTEDAESYPGKSSFGKFAYCCKTIEQAEGRYAELVQKVKELTEKDLVDTDANEVEDTTKNETKKESKATGGKRGRKPIDRSTIKMPKDRFTMKQLELLNPGVSFGFLYQHLRSLLDKEYTIVDTITGGRGKPKIVYAPIEMGTQA